MRVVGYARLSRENHNGMSIEVQIEKIKLYAQLHDYELIDLVVDDGISGKTLERDGIQRVLSMLVSGQAQGLIVAKLDRLTRSLRDLDNLLHQYFYNGKMVLMSTSEDINTSTATGRMILNLIVMIAQWERETISERTTEALAHKKSKGELTGMAPYGFRVGEDGKTLVEDENEQCVIRLVKKWHSEGTSERKIVERLADVGKVNRKGNKLGKTQVHAIIHNS